MVNSEFTARVFASTFPSASKRTTPDIVYPSIRFDALDAPPAPGFVQPWPESASAVFLSINRYERKKNLPLALQAFAALRTRVADSV